MAKSRKIWVFSPPKQAKPRLPNALKANMTAEANDLIDTILKPTHVKHPAGDERFNYVVDIYSKWYRNYFYFCSKYACPGPNAISPYFEARFARLEYVGNERFNLAYMRHTGKWWEIYTELSLVECLDVIRDEPHFLP
ncbi:MAG: hypothetical protein JRF50_17765 [Deltaproteobacteria bacterium]|nr:hypothetical protein [Deltaproteobacteria bacterium]